MISQTHLKVTANGGQIPNQMKGSCNRSALYSGLQFDGSKKACCVCNDPWHTNAKCKTVLTAELSPSQDSADMVDAERCTLL